MGKLTHPSEKIIQTFEMLKSGKSVKFDDIVAKMGVKPVTVMVFICALRSDFGADILTERTGRKLDTYRLTNADKVAPLMVLKTKASKATKKVAAPKVKATKFSKVVAKKAKMPKESDFDVPTLEVEEVNDDADLAALKAELGFADGYAE